RRIDARPEPTEAYVSLPATEEIAVDQTREALRNVTGGIASDPQQWRHLGDPADGERVLGDRSVLTDEASYTRALATVAGEPVSPPAWSVSLLLDVDRDVTVGTAQRVRILLANRTTVPDGGDRGLLEPALFDAGLEIRIESGTLVPFEFLLAPKDYRSNPLMAALGINCSVIFDPSARTLRTETLPVYQQPLFRTRDDIPVSFADLESEDPFTALTRVSSEMSRYLRDWDEFLRLEATSRFSDAEREACTADRNGFSEELDRFQLGVTALREHHNLLRAFRLMNGVFRRLSETSGGKVTAWRLFQIGFIVSQLPALAIRELPNTREDDYSSGLKKAFDEVGVLWFPTGGGKTEAYLGLIAAALIFDRLRGKHRGVTAWMRFPLRMLSLQQLERLARVIAALNVLRKEDPEVGAGDPFAIGYYVGDGVTPNSVHEDAMNRYVARESDREALRVLRKCPFCGSPLHIHADRSHWRILHRCANGECFSNTEPAMREHRGSIPLCITDNEIYRYLPSVLVGTVDKLAIIARAKHFTHILNGPQQYCRIHGYTSYDECVERWNCKATKKDLRRLEASHDPCPSLLVQDELHLLRSELGVFNGHYEGLVRYVSSRRGLPSKVLAATATIEAYDVHAFHVYLSRARRYPAPSYQNGESFYATSSPLVLRRSFVGILSHTRGVEDATNRALALYWGRIRQLERAPLELKAILGRPELTDEQSLAILRLYDLSLVYVNRKATGGSILTRLGRVNAALVAAGAEPIHGQLLTGDNLVEDVG
ncbi:MAG TPA: hypothetical protein VJ837_02320, partial [Candidatus Paceibacterota bacterium]|nr:hypothetical protein [Candidatus Paceibacterota bacterium]